MRKKKARRKRRRRRRERRRKNCRPNISVQKPLVPVSPILSRS